MGESPQKRNGVLILQKIIMSGDEAVARGAWEAGVSVAAAYPGTPSTEILENMALLQKGRFCS